MCKEVTFFASSSGADNTQALDILSRSKLTVINAGNYPSLEENVRMPAIYTDEGSRYFGVEDIKYFVDEVLKYLP